MRRLVEYSDSSDDDREHEWRAFQRQRSNFHGFQRQEVHGASSSAPVAPTADAVDVTASDPIPTTKKRTSMPFSFSRRVDGAPCGLWTSPMAEPNGTTTWRTAAFPSTEYPTTRSEPVFRFGTSTQAVTSSMPSPQSQKDLHRAAKKRGSVRAGKSDDSHSPTGEQRDSESTDQTQATGSPPYASPMEVSEEYEPPYKFTDAPATTSPFGSVDSLFGASVSLGGRAERSTSNRRHRFTPSSRKPPSTRKSVDSRSPPSAPGATGEAPRQVFVFGSTTAALGETFSQGFAEGTSKVTTANIPAFNPFSQQKPDRSSTPPNINRTTRTFSFGQQATFVFGSNQSKPSSATSVNQPSSTRFSFGARTTASESNESRPWSFSASPIRPAPDSEPASFSIGSTPNSRVGGRHKKPGSESKSTSARKLPGRVRPLNCATRAQKSLFQTPDARVSDEQPDKQQSQYSVHNPFEYVAGTHYTWSGKNEQHDDRPSVTTNIFAVPPRTSATERATTGRSSQHQIPTVHSAFSFGRVSGVSSESKEPEPSPPVEQLKTSFGGSFGVKQQRRGEASPGTIPKSTSMDSTFVPPRGVGTGQSPFGFHGEPCTETPVDGCSTSAVPLSSEPNSSGVPAADPFVTPLFGQRRHSSRKGAHNKKTHRFGARLPTNSRSGDQPATSKTHAQSGEVPTKPSTSSSFVFGKSKSTWGSAGGSFTSAIPTSTNIFRGSTFQADHVPGHTEKEPMSTGFVFGQAKPSWGSAEGFGFSRPTTPKTTSGFTADDANPFQFRPKTASAKSQAPSGGTEAQRDFVFSKTNKPPVEETSSSMPNASGDGSRPDVSSRRILRAVPQSARNAKNPKDSTLDEEQHADDESCDWGEWKLRGGTAYSSRDFRGAAECYRKSIAILEDMIVKHPELRTEQLMKDKAKLHANRAASLMMLMLIPEAQRECLLSIEADPSYTRAYLRLGRIQVLLGDAPRALENVDICNRLFALAPHERHDGDVESLEKIKAGVEKLQNFESEIKWCLDVRDYSRALTYLQDALSLAPSCRAFQLQKAQALLFQKSYPMVEEYCCYLVKKHGSSLERHESSTQDATKTEQQREVSVLGIELSVIRIKALHYQNKVDEATQLLAVLERVAPCSAAVIKLRREFNEMKSLKHRANEMFKVKAYDLATRLYSEALLIDPAHDEYCAVIYCNRAAALMGSEEFGRARLDCDEALRRKARYPRALLRRARCNVALKKYASAVSDFNKYLKEHPHDSSSGLAADIELEKLHAQVALDNEAAEKKRREAEKKKERQQRQKKSQQQHHHQHQYSWDDGAWGYGSSNARTNGAPGSNSRAHTNGGSSGGRSSTGYVKHQRRTHYEVLGILKTASQDEIKKAYRKLALLHHPDKAKDTNQAELFKDMTAAYTVLSDVSARSKYDRELQYGGFGRYYEY